MNQIQQKMTELLELLTKLEIEEQIDTLNKIRVKLHEISPFANEPVDCVLWVKAETLSANDYNPNTVATPEMKLLEHSISEDGYTQPIVTWQENGSREVVDGFHRNKIGITSKKINKRIFGYLPVTTINDERTDRRDRIAATIRHNRARGRHQVAAMSEIVVELAKKGWDSEKIGKELGMDADEVLRLRQISGLAEMFANHEFSEAWEINIEKLKKV